jgi:alpha-beta hydrolase superfamily lysophospholipase
MDRRNMGRAGSAWIVAAMTAAVVALAVAPTSALWAQNPPNRPKAAGKGPNGKGPRLPAARKAPNAADPLAPRAAEKEKAETGSFHYRLKLHTADDVVLAATYYPGKPDTSTPVILLVHEKDRSYKDFEDPIAELKGEGLALHLQGLGYAVLSFDLRGHGVNARRPLGQRDWNEMPADLQAAYLFLLDRHNRGELNISRLGVIGLGEGANVAALWAYAPGGAVSHEGRVTDLAGLVLISPLATFEGAPFTALMNALAPRIPVSLMAGERDAPSHDAVKRVRANVERTRQNRVELFPSSLHGYKLLRFEPKATVGLLRFLESNIKLKVAEWEPRYNLSPITYNDIEVIRHVKPTDAEKAKEKEKEKEKQKKDAAEKEKKAPEKNDEKADDVDKK